MATISSRNPVFVDSAQFIAFIRPEDDLHEDALEVAELLDDSPLITTESVLIEVLNWFCGLGPAYRRQAVMLVREVRGGDGIKVEPQTAALIERALQLYGSRLDKDYSGTDCISMVVCQDVGVREVATSDHGFEQEGYTILLG